MPAPPLPQEIPPVDSWTPLYGALPVEAEVFWRMTPEQGPTCHNFMSTANTVMCKISVINIWYAGRMILSWYSVLLEESLCQQRTSLSTGVDQIMS